MRTLKLFILGLIMSFSFTACTVSGYATTQDDIYVESSADIVRSNIDYNIVFRFGTPYYYEGRLLYYLYEGLYYYPYLYDNYWYMRVYRRPFNHLYYRPYFRPHRYDYRFDRSFRPHSNWHHDYYRSNRYYNNPRPRTPYPSTRVTPSRPHTGYQPRVNSNPGINRGGSSVRSSTSSRSITPSRSSSTRGGFNSGGSRGRR